MPLRRFPFVSLLVASALASAVPALAQDCVDYTTRTHWIGRLPGEEEYGYGAVRSPYAYIVVGTSRGAQLWVVEMDEQAGPRVVGKVRGVGAGEVALEGDYAFVSRVSGDASDLTIIDVSRPDRPHKVAAVYLGGIQHQRIAVANGYAWVQDLGGDVWTVDVRDPTAPVVVGMFHASFPYDDLAADGNQLYLAERTLGFQIYDVTDPAAPVPVLRRDTPDCRDVVVQNGIAYVVDASDGMRIYDVSVPGQANLLSFFSGRPGQPQGNDRLTVSDGYAYRSGRWIADVSDPSNPTWVNGLIGDTRADMKAEGSYAMIPFHTFDVLALGEPGEPARMDVDLTANGGAALVRDGDFLVIGGRTGDFSGVVSIVDVSDPDAPVLRGDLAVAAEPQDLAAASDRVVLGEGQRTVVAGSLHVLDVSDPDQPIELGAVAVDSRIYALDWEGGIVCAILSHAFGIPPDLGLFDVTDPTAIVERSRTPVTGTGIALRGNLAYVMGGDALQVFDVTDPDAPVEVGSLPGVGLGAAIELVGDVAYVGNFAAVDITDPTHPFLIAARVLPEYPGSFAVQDGYAYCTTGDGVYIVDVAVPELPVIGTILDPLFTEAGAVVNGRLWFLHRSGYPSTTPTGLYSAPLQCGTSPRTTTDATASAPIASAPSAPNPFRDRVEVRFSMPAPGDAEAALWDVTGRRVRSWRWTSLPAGPQRMTWNGRSDAGGAVAPGIYFYEIRAGGSVQRGKVTLVR